MSDEYEFEPEKLTEPFVDADYDARTGYDENFLGIPVPMPKVADLSAVCEMFEGGHVIPYEHFSVIMHRNRRLALLTAANIDGGKASKEPEPGLNYGRRALSGLGKNDLEKWVVDPRLDTARQLPDKFYTRDRGNFDKGHIVRRDDVAWGASYEELRRANGDTYHVTNCSPQVDAFNRSNLRGDWGKLENYILDQGRLEKICVFAGPVLNDENDKIFKGKDDQGDVEVQIPSLFWKVVVARNGDHLETFGFLLEQDLSQTDVEFNVSADWQGKMISIKNLENLIPDLVFAESVRKADQADQKAGQTIRAAGSFESYISPTSPPSTKNLPQTEMKTMPQEPLVWSDKDSPVILKTALQNRNREKAEELLNSLCTDLDDSGRLIDANAAKEVLAALRNYAWFDKLHQIAGKFEQNAQDDDKVLLHLAQARIELGEITTAVGELRELREKLDQQLSKPDIDPTIKKLQEKNLSETMGLLGRCYKQLYINAKPSQKVPRQQDLDESLNYYREAYQRGIGDYLWHGINCVALLNHQVRVAANRSNSISDEGKCIAENILTAIRNKEVDEQKLYFWDLANRIEAYLAIGKTPEAVEATRVYLDALEEENTFALQSTRRQLIEVWMLDESRPPGDVILPLMNARFAELGGVPEVIELDLTKAKNYEKVWGDTGYVSLGWLKKAFDRAKTVARIGPNKYEGHGTGFLFDGAWIGAEWAGKPLLLTNAHVCSNDPEVQKQYPYPSPPEELVAAFLGSEGAGSAEEIRVKKAVWTSKPSELDATLLLLERIPDGLTAPPKTARTPPVVMAGDARLNILGHPKGLDLRISLQDNKVVDVGDRYVHYRTPTDPGSSGSPVFNQAWDLVALHHSSSTQKQANEGIRIDVIVDAIKAKLA